jgi:hypothetical protein
MGFPKVFSIYGLGVVSGSALTWSYKFFFDPSGDETPAPIAVQEKKPKPGDYFDAPESYFPNKLWDKNWDRRQHFYEREKKPAPEESSGQVSREAPRSSATRHIFLIRHGTKSFSLVISTFKRDKNVFRSVQSGWKR